ncbi:MAG: hypothetical protein ABSA65_15630 [Acidimicrobiales bacterium]|jgi:hypothetical protein
MHGKEGLDYEIGASVEAVQKTYLHLGDDLKAPFDHSQGSDCAATTSATPPTVSAELFVKRVTFPAQQLRIPHIRITALHQ